MSLLDFKAAQHELFFLLKLTATKDSVETLKEEPTKKQVDNFPSRLLAGRGTCDAFS